jgi:F-type H+-transporting ATPase subunit b
MFHRSKTRHRGGRVSTRAGAVATVFALAVFDVAPLLAQEEHGGGGGGLFDINPGIFIWTWLIFVVLLLVLRKWAWGPILGALETREKRIQDVLDGAAHERGEAAKLLEEQRKLLDESRDQAQQILADSRKAGERVRAEIVEEARKQGDQIVGRAREDIERERDHALELLRREAVDLSISAASRVLSREVDSSENRRLVEDYLESLTGESRGDQKG